MVGTMISKPVVLCNAQAYGFGPAAIFHVLLPHLRFALHEEDLSLQYVGSGHTLALNRRRDSTIECANGSDKEGVNGWDEVYDLDVNESDGPKALTRLCEKLRPVLFVTVCDETAGMAALAAGIPIVVIDPLLWYWKDIPETWHRAEMVLAADFEGVRARVWKESLNNVLVVPAVAPSLTDNAHARTSRDADAVDTSVRKGILVNMGGLRRPFVPVDEHVAYARVIDRAVRRALSAYDELRSHATSLQVIAAPEMVEALGPEKARTVDPKEAQALLRSTSLVCMTPGLGNLFEASVYAQNVLTLPPSSNSQGQQMVILKRLGLLDRTIDWHELVGGEPVDYWSPSQESMQDIHAAQHKLIDMPEAQARLERHVFDAIRDSESSIGVTPLRGLVERFGERGEKVMAEAIADFIKRIGRATPRESLSRHGDT